MLALPSHLSFMPRLSVVRPSIDVQASAQDGSPTHRGRVASGVEDPRLRVTLGPLRILDSTSPREYTIGRAPASDIILGGSYSALTSRQHCKLIWDGTRLRIIDLRSANGTWVNYRRLADGEARVLRDNDRVTFTPLPIDERSPSGDPGGYAFFNSTLGQPDALECVYTEHTTDTLMSKLSPVGRIVRQSMDELLRIHRLISSTQETMGAITPAVQTPSVVDGFKTYRGPLDRPERPVTPFYDSPLPLRDTPAVREELRRRPLWSGPEDPDGLPADHPDLIWSYGVRYKHTPGINPPPLEIRHWSMHYHLPVGLHRDWPYISPVAYGGYLHITPAQRPQVIAYAHHYYPDYAVPELSSPGRSPSKADTLETSSKPPCVPTGSTPKESTEHHVEDKPEKPFIAPSPACKTEVIEFVEPPVAASVSPLRPPPITDVHLALPSTTLAPSRTLKRSRADGHDDSVGRPAKRIAVNELSTRKLSPLPRNPPDTPIATTSASHTTAATESSSSFGISLKEHHSKTPGRCRDPRVANAHEPSATIDTAPVHAREEARAPKRKRDAEVDEDTASRPQAKRSRAIQPLQSVRRSLRVREKAAIVP